ncbi:MAG: AraC family transcriptional regulator ligand-binding domain-containing protein [Pseudomonadales bacterium]|nr:AraC family transcriptional regulator ligand-binding domain-containing protein [Pseudomonadales bacterium]
MKNTSMRNTIAIDDGIISGQYHLRQLCVYLTQRQFDPQPMFTASDIPNNILDDKSARISYSQYRQALLYGRNCLKDAAFGLHLGQAFTEDSHGLIGLSAQCSANFQDALLTAVEFKKVFSPITTLAFKQAGNYSYLECKMSLSWDDEAVTRLLIETCFAYLFKAILALLPEIRPQVFFEFSYAEPDYLHDYQQCLNNHLHFNGAKNRMIFPTSCMQKTLPMANRWLLEEVEAIKQQALHAQEPRQGLMDLIETLLLQKEPAISTQEQLAKQLNTTISTLKRRLNKHHCSFQCLWDDVRKHQACEMLENVDTSVADVARQMNFSDVASFRKAFKRWIGLSPQAYREGMKAWLTGDNQHGLMLVDAQDEDHKPGHL